MLEISMFDMNKFVHMFIKNLGLRIESPTYKNSSKMTFITYIDRTYRTKQKLLDILEKIRKDINMQQNLDFSNEKSMQYFIEKHTNLLNQFNALSNTQILTSHLKNINIKILQKIRARKKNIENLKKMEPKILSKNVSCKKKIRVNLDNKLNGLKKNSAVTMLRADKRITLHNHKKNKYKNNQILENSKIFCHDVITLNNCKNTAISRVKNYNPKVLTKHNLQSNMISTVKKEIKMAEKFLWLCIKDVEYIKSNVEITLYIAKKKNYDIRDQVKYNQDLCHYALLSFIEPSEKAFLLFEDNLSLIIQKYLSKGYKYHFEFQRDSQDYYTALLILNHWAKILLKHTNATMMYAICGILGCNVQNILVLCSPDEK